MQHLAANLLTPIILVIHLHRPTFLGLPTPPSPKISQVSLQPPRKKNKIKLVSEVSALNFRTPPPLEVFWQAT